MSSLNIVIQEVSTDVVATVSGAIDLTGLSIDFTQLIADGINGGSAGSGGELKFSNSTLTRYNGMSSGIAQGPFGNNQLTAGDTLSINNSINTFNFSSGILILSISSCAKPKTSFPKTFIFPFSGSTRRTMHFNSTDFPEPDLPNTARFSPL
jgi:hypothetical protein